MQASLVGSAALTWLHGKWDGTTSFVVRKTSFVNDSCATISLNQNYTTMSQPLKQISIWDELMSSAEDSPVNHSVTQETEKEQMMTATYGRRCLELSESVHPVGSWERMFAESLICLQKEGQSEWYSSRCVLTWKIVGTQFNSIYYHLLVSTPHTDETEFSLLPTITARCCKDGTAIERPEGQPSRRSELNHLIAQEMQKRLLPTPTATDYKGATSPAAIHNNRNRKNLLRNVYLRLDDDYDSLTSQLSPLFAAEMMGFPKDWTVLPFQLGEEKA